MDKFKEKINQLKSEIDASNARADLAEKKLSVLSEQLAGKGNKASDHSSKMPKSQFIFQRSPWLKMI